MLVVLFLNKKMDPFTGFSYFIFSSPEAKQKVVDRQREEYHAELELGLVG